MKFINGCERERMCALPEGHAGDCDPEPSREKYDQAARLSKLRKQSIVPPIDMVPAPQHGMYYCRCEFLGCQTAVYSFLPEGWSQTGPSRYADALAGMASWCPEHCT